MSETFRVAAQSGSLARAKLKGGGVDNPYPDFRDSRGVLGPHPFSQKVLAKRQEPRMIATTPSAKTIDDIAEDIKMDKIHSSVSQLSNDDSKEFNIETRLGGDAKVKIEKDSQGKIKINLDGYKDVSDFVPGVLNANNFVQTPDDSRGEAILRTMERQREAVSEVASKLGLDKYSDIVFATNNFALKFRKNPAGQEGEVYELYGLPKGTPYPFRITQLRNEDSGFDTVIMINAKGGEDTTKLDYFSKAGSIRLRYCDEANQDSIIYQGVSGFAFP